MFIKICFLSVLASYGSSVKPLSEDTAHVIAGGGGIAAGLTSGIVAGIFLKATGLSEKIGADGTFFITALSALGTGAISWWGLENALGKLTPQSRYLLVQDLMHQLELDLKDKRNSSLNRTLSRVLEVKEIVQDIAREIANDLDVKKLYAECREILVKLVELEKKVTIKLNYKNALDNLVAVENDSLLSRDFNPAMLLTHVQMRFGTNWPLIEARNNLKTRFGQIIEAQRYLNKVMQSKISEKMHEKSAQAEQKALVLTEKLESCMQMVLEHVEYEQQKILYEHDRIRKQQQSAYMQAMEKEQQHQKELERQRQRHEREMREREAQEKQQELERQNKEKQKEREFKRSVIEHVPDVQVHADVKI